MDLKCGFVQKQIHPIFQGVSCMSYIPDIIRGKISGISAVNEKDISWVYKSNFNQYRQKIKHILTYQHTKLSSLPIFVYLSNISGNVTAKVPEIYHFLAIASPQLFQFSPKSISLFSFRFPPRIWVFYQKLSSHSRFIFGTHIHNTDRRTKWPYWILFLWYEWMLINDR